MNWGNIVLDYVIGALNAQFRRSEEQLVDGFISDDATFHFFEGKWISAGFRVFGVWPNL